MARLGIDLVRTVTAATHPTAIGQQAVSSAGAGEAVGETRDRPGEAGGSGAPPTGIGQDGWMR
ncbi:hypothetical protein Sme01_23670 [Sphaerisporangium melleum]|uniref:Uncharacterized protein n=1 Tax=Sphaerisporangium melleum TaxID=321316 RepID=A0A917QSB2_9ACTN|nr:hypothetical protein [Sphaerisporangium melleum]GGK65966.1 hypothetical protein GCM10007964_06270 [Sphaerisporangium melleum]GII69891.1 hypothetical protein Sme01_23670 [Sphaerisporangium melleum]